MNRKKYLSAFLAAMMLISVVPAVPGAYADAKTKATEEANEPKEGEIYIKFNLTGGTIDNKSEDVKLFIDKDTEFKDVKIGEPKRNGYDFIGWFDKFGKQLEPKTKLSEDIKVEAKWEPTKIKEEKKAQEKEELKAFKLNFKDVQKGVWYDEAVTYAVKNNFMVGVTDDTFNPNGYTTRAMMVSILNRMGGKHLAKESYKFNDVPMGQWYTDAVNWAVENKIASGVAKETFAPHKQLTREQLITMLYNFAKQEKVVKETVTDLSEFKDAGNVSPYAKEAMIWGLENGIISGMGDHQLFPKAGATRAQMAVILRNYNDKFGK